MNSQARATQRHQLTPLALCIALAMPAGAWAQTQNADKADSTLPAVGVKAAKQRDTTEGTGSYTTTGKTKTATPLGLSLRDTPQSVSVVTRQRIEDQSMLTVTDAVNNVTGVSVNQYETNRGQFTARGFKINTLMIDGVPTTWEQPWSSGEILTSLAPYDRVEMVRGSTGLTTGAGDPSAAINLVRKRANSKTLQGTVETDVGSWNQRRVMGDLQAPLNEAQTVRGRVVAEHTERDSWVDGLHNQSQTLYATLEADLGPHTLLSTGLTHQTHDTDGPMWGGLPVWYSDGSRAHWDRSKTTAADWTRWDTDHDSYFVTLDHRFANDWKVKASYNQSDRRADSYLLYLMGAPNAGTGLGMFTWPGSYKVSTQQEDMALQASGPFQLLGRSHELALGYTHSRQDFRARSRAAAGGSAPNFNTWDGSYAEPAWGPLSYYGNGTVTQEAVYGAARLSLSDPLKLILGARWTNYERKGDDYQATPAYKMKFEREFTPYAGIVYDLNDTYSAYASYTDIFQPQQKRDVDGNYLDPIVGTSTEVGVKGEFLEGRVNASAAVFRIQQDKLAQATGSFVTGTTAETAYRASEGATSEGFELDVSGELAPGWNASAGYSQFKAKDASGKDVNSIYPRKLLRLFTTYRLPGAWNALTLGGGVNWEGATYTNAQNPLGVVQKIDQNSYALVNLMARYDFSPQLSAQLNVHNVFDKTYYGMFDAYSQFTYGAPRSATLSLKYKF